MTIPEAARLVLQAASLGETGQVLVLDMGEPIRIADLARSMIRLAGRSETEIAIEYTGLRAGEKLFEELLADEDVTVPTRIERLRIAKLQDEVDAAAMAAWLRAAPATACGRDEVRAWLGEMVREYNPR
jgi:FlaA1/EpsC-like NDP-sugar epimerase